MATSASKLVELERERDTIREEVHGRLARLAGLEAEIAALRSGLRPEEPLAETSLADGVEQILRVNGRMMSPTEIHEALIAGGRQDQLKSVGGTLQHLKRQGRVVSVSRGKWQSTIAP